MTDNAYQHLARQMLGLWQEQISSVMHDKRFIHAMLDLVRTMQQAPDDAAQASPSHAAVPPDVDAHALAELRFRLAMCERRIAVLEQKRAGKAAPSKRNAARHTGKGNAAKRRKPS